MMNSGVNDSTQTVKLWYLKEYDFFGELKGEARDYVKAHTSMQHYKAKDYIYLTGAGYNVYLLKQGEVKISRVRDNGEEIIQDILRPGEIFGCLPMLDQDAGRDREFAQAASQTIVCSIDRRNFELFMDKYPRFNQKLTKWYGLRMRRFEERLNDIIFKDVKKRMAGFLYRYAREFGKVKEGTYEIKPLLTHEEIGLLIGAARQTVTTTLNELREAGFVEPGRKCWKVQRIEELRKMAA